MKPATCKTGTSYTINKTSLCQGATKRDKQPAARRSHQIGLLYQLAEIPFVFALALDVAL